jgi:hypothetical protein
MALTEDLEARIDDVLAASFPASDPPPWTTGVEGAWRATTAQHRAAEEAAAVVEAKGVPAAESY